MLGVGVAVLAIVLFARIPEQGRWVSDLSNAAHGPAFAAVTLIVLALLRRSPRRKLAIPHEYWLAPAVAVVLGALVELLQIPVGRDAGLDDLGRDAVGAPAAAGFLMVFDHKAGTSPSRHALRRTGFLVAIAALVMILAPLTVTAGAYLQRYARFPTLVDFGSPFSTYFLSLYSSVTAERSPLPRGLQTPGSDSIGLHARLTGNGIWALTLRETAGDWRGYEHLKLDIVNPTGEPLVLRLRVHDRAHAYDYRSGYRESIEIAPNSRAIRSIALTALTATEGIARVDTSQVYSVVIADKRANRAREFYVMRIWLDR